MGLKVKSKLRIGGLSVASVFAVSVPMVFAPVRSMAQTTTASLGGTVTDTSGAVIAKAAVTLTNSANGAVQSTVSNKDGIFSFAAVQSGDYTLSIVSKGFETFSETGVHLDPQDKRLLRDLKLAVGSASETTTVEATEQGLSVDGGEISSLITAEDIKHLAIEGRDVTELLKILPGFTPVTNSVSNSVYDPSQVGVSGAVGQYSGNGSPLYAVALLSDGADITDPGNFGATIQTVNYDQVAEVKVQTASMTADSAHGPIIINALGAYGGNQFHGSVYVYGRTTQLNSVDWYAKHVSQAKPDDRQIYPGFTFGGPVVLPFLTHFNQAKKLNFWVGAEDYAQRNVYAYNSAAQATITGLVPTAAMRAGDFSQGSISNLLGAFYKAPITGPNGFQVQQCSPNYLNICEVPQIGEDGSTISNGNIAAFLDPGAKILINLYPLPSPQLLAPGPGQPYNYVHTNVIAANLWQARGRLDYALGEKTKIFSVYSTETGRTAEPQLEYRAPTAASGSTNSPGGLLNSVHTQLGVLNVSTIIKPTLTNEFYASFTYFNQTWTNRTNDVFLSTTGYPYQGLYNNGTRAIPAIQDFQYDGLPYTSYLDETAQGFIINKFVRTGGDNVTKQLGNHTIRGGAFFQMDTNNQPGGSDSPINGNIQTSYYPELFTTVTGQFLHNTGERGSGSGGNYLANFSEGHVSNFNQQNFSPGSNLFFLNIAGYAQDHWRLLSNLSVDYGLRIEHITPWSDAHGVGVPVWNANAYLNDASGSPLPGFLWHDINHSVPLSGFDTRWGYIEPRVGASWDVFRHGNTILRGGFGIYRAHDSYNDAASGQANTVGVRTLFQQNTTLKTVDVAHAPIVVGSLAAASGTTILEGVLAGDDETPQVKTWDFAVVQKLPKKMQLQMAYVGSYSNEMLNDGADGSNFALDNINALPVGALYSTGKYTYGNYSQVQGLSAQQVNAFRPYPNYLGLDIASHKLYSNYNGLQTSLLKQSGHLLFNLNYTFSKALGILGSRGNGAPSDPTNLRNNYLPETFDRTHVFNASYTYQVGTPFRQTILRKALNNWEVSGITNVLSGPSLQSISRNLGLSGTVTGAPNPTITNVNANYSLPLSSAVFLGTTDVRLQPQLLCDPRASGNHNYIKPECFSLPTALGTNGAYRFPYIKGPGYFQSDLTLTRGFTLPREQGLHLRVAAFNVLNRANTSFNGNVPQEYQLSYNYTNPTLTGLTAPSTLASIPNANASTFGHASLKTGRRIMEISLKYNF